MKKIKCSRCGSTFTTTKGLNKHMKEKHPTYYMAKKLAPLPVLAVIVVIVILLLPQQGSNTMSKTTVVSEDLRTKIPSNGAEVGVGVVEGDVAPDFTVFDIAGREVSLSSFRGSKVILWFMAVWCPSCAVVGPIIRNNQGENVVIVIDIWTEKNLKEVGLINRADIPPPEDEKELLDFISKYGKRDWILILDNYGLAKLYRLKYVDSTFVVDEEGRIVLRSDGPVSPSLLKYALQQS